MVADPGFINGFRSAAFAKYLFVHNDGNSGD